MGAMKLIAEPNGGATLGLRERKKLRTRDVIADTALRLFADRGFDRVSVAEVARAAEVAEQTVFNYFSTKEDLVYWRLEGFEQRLLQAIEQRAIGETVLSAFRGFVLKQQGLLGREDADAKDQLTAINRTIAQSRSLLAREREVFDRYASVLASSIVLESGTQRDDLQARIVAQTLVGVQRALVEYVRQELLAGRSGPQLRERARTKTRLAFDLLKDGLADYGAR